MINQNSASPVDPALLETWLKGWSLARTLPAPVKDNGVLRVDVGWPEQVMRYVFPGPAERLVYLAQTIVDPWIFLKVCAEPETIRALLPSHWVIQAPGFLMTCYPGMSEYETKLPEGYKLSIDEHLAIPMVNVLAPDLTVAASGRIAFVDGFGIYDSIETHPDHRRKGLGSIVMKNLESAGITRGISKGLLVATAQGKVLYEKLGWSLYSPYTTAVIPGA